MIHLTYGVTYISTRQPWGTNDRNGHRLLCSDGAIRAAELASTADSFFSTPAKVRVKGKTVSGYMTSEETKLAKVDLRAYVFRHHDQHKDKLPTWPASFTQEMDDLIALAHPDLSEEGPELTDKE